MSRFNQSQQQQPQNIKGPGIQCPSHPQFEITNICMSAQCLEPLCPECVKVHNMLHEQHKTPQQIDTVQSVRQQCMDHLTFVTKQFQNERGELERFSDIQQGQLISKYKVKLDRAKEKVFQIVTNFFQTLEQQIAVSIEEHRHLHPGEYRKLNDKSDTILKRLNKQLDKVKGDNYLKPVLKVLTQDQNNEFEQMRTEIEDAIDKYHQDMADVFVDDKLQSYVVYKTGGPPQDFHLSPQKQQFSQMQSIQPQMQQHQVVQSKAPIDRSQYKFLQDHPQLATQSLNPSSNKIFSEIKHPDYQSNVSNKQEKQMKLGYQTGGNFKSSVAIPNILNKYQQSYHQDEQRVNDSQLNQNLTHFLPGSSKIVQQQSQFIGQSLLSPQKQYESRILQQSTPPQPSLQFSLNLFKKKQNSPKGKLATGNMKPNQKDYFNIDCKCKCLCYFQDNSKKFYYLNLEELLSNPQQMYFSEFQMKINFNVPYYHRSIITPSGDIYLTGGLDPLPQKYKPISYVYKFNLQAKTLENDSFMIVSRHSHGICFCDGTIYVAGGNSNDENEICTNRCEKYDINAKRWIEIAPMVNKSTGLSLAAFNDQAIFKFGGRIDALTKDSDIEKYDLIQNKWTVISLRQQSFQKMPSFSAAIQINISEIFIFGGLMNDSAIEDCYLLKVQDHQVSTTSINAGELIQLSNCKLPGNGTFLSNPLLYGQNIYAILNSSYEKGSYSNFQGKKIPIIFNNQQWQAI